MTAPATVPQDRPSKLMDAARLICPRCGRPIRRMTMGDGHGTATCDNAERHERKCGQHMYIRGSDDGAATVMPISKTEHEVLTARGLPSRRHCLILLGVLRSRNEEHVPKTPCTRCTKHRKRYDLFNGVCRWCITDEPAPDEEGPYAIAANGAGRGL